MITGRAAGISGERIPGKSKGPHARDEVRDPRSFETFAPIAGVDGAQLEQWVQATRMETISATEWKWKGAWSVGPRVIGDSMWFSFLRGSGRGWVGSPENAFRYRTGDLLLVPRGMRHFVEEDPGSEAHLVVVHFQALLFGSVDFFTILEFPALIRGTRVVDHRAASAVLAREFAHKPALWRSVADTQMMGVLFDLLRHSEAHCRLRAAGPSLAALPRFLPVFEKIEERLGDANFSVADMAGIIHLGEVQFRKLFRRVTGINPIGFLQRRRVERACVLLRSTARTIESISNECGFRDSPFFHRVFKKWTGLNPSQYRETSRF